MNSTRLTESDPPDGILLFLLTFYSSQKLEVTALRPWLISHYEHLGFIVTFALSENVHLSQLLEANTYYLFWKKKSGVCETAMALGPIKLNNVS